MYAEAEGERAPQTPVPAAAGVNLRASPFPSGEGGREGEGEKDAAAYKKRAPGLSRAPRLLAQPPHG